MLKAITFKKEHIPYLIAFALIMAMYLPRTFAASTIEGTIFKDLNRNGVQDAGEEPVAGLRVDVIDLTADKAIAGASTDANGHYIIAQGYSWTEVPNGKYLVYISTGSPGGWWDYDDDWAPTDTSKSVYPKETIDLVGSATVNFPLRPIVKAADRYHPISTYTGPNGLRTESYNDVYTAQDVYDSVMRGGYVGEEATSVKVSIAMPGVAGYTATGYNGTQGNYTSLSSNSNCPYDSVRPSHSLFEGKMNDRCINHEYGHAWSSYYGILFQQDNTFTAYQKARGTYGDPRVNTSYQWSVAEQIAEDYRQLLGSPASQVGGQINWEIPLAKDVPGLKDFLLNDFRTKVAVPPPADTTPPSTSTNLQQTNRSTDSLSFSWTPSTDNVGVKEYEVFRNWSLVATTTNAFFSDNGLTPDTTYTYFVRARDAAGNTSPPSSNLNLTTSANTVPPPPASANVIISGLSVSPNPVSLSSKTNPVIKYSLDQAATTKVTIVNATGGLVRQLFNGSLGTGGQQSTWDRKDSNGRKVRAGTYTIKVEATGVNGITVSQTLTFKAK